MGSTIKLVYGGEMVGEVGLLNAWYRVYGGWGLEIRFVKLALFMF